MLIDQGAGAVVFADRPPLPLARIRSPLLPRGASFVVFLKPNVFRAGLAGLVRLHGARLASCQEMRRALHQRARTPRMRRTAYTRRRGQRAWRATSVS